LTPKLIVEVLTNASFILNKFQLCYLHGTLPWLDGFADGYKRLNFSQDFVHAE
jgi:hypothetical protein